MGYLVFVPLGYLVGSLPFGLIAGKVVGRVDVRDYGSGSTGSTNVLRTVGVKTGVIVLLLDMGKSVVVVLAAGAFSDSAGVRVAAATAALIGHIWPVFVGFRGGKGTAPGWGGLIALSPVAGILGGAIGVSAIALRRYVSLGSLLGAISGAVVLVALSLAGREPVEYVWYAIVGTSLVVARHRDNIRRLVRGEERKLRKPVREPKAAQKTDQARA